jgi:hypothetical protein
MFTSANLFGLTPYLRGDRRLRARLDWRFRGARRPFVGIGLGVRLSIISANFSQLIL